MAMKTVLTTMRAVTLGLEAVLLAVLTIWFNDRQVAREGALLTHLSVLLLGMISIAALFRGAWSFGWVFCSLLSCPREGMALC